MARTTHFFLSAVALALLACKSFEAVEEPVPSVAEGGTDAANGTDSSTSGGIVDAGADSATCASIDAGCGSGCCAPLVCNGAQRCATTCRAFSLGCDLLAQCCEGLACDSTSLYCCKISGQACAGAECCGGLQCTAGFCQ